MHRRRLEMIRALSAATIAIMLCACRHEAPSHAQITELKADPSFIASGVTARLCYGVENATRLELNPRVEPILPASNNCIDVSPKETTVYTLTAYGADNKPETREVQLKVGPPQPRVADLTATPKSVKTGRKVEVCFKVQNAKSVTARPGKFDRSVNCIIDYPKKTTTYRVTAHGDDREEDTGTVTVTVVR
jgi:hypothetical protein